jgi:hypothetical protein
MCWLVAVISKPLTSRKALPLKSLSDCIAAAPAGTRLDAAFPCRSNASEEAVMRRRLPILLLSATVVSDIGAAAQAPSDAGQIDGVRSTGAAQSGPLASTTLRVPGTIDKYEMSTRVLSLSTANGEVQFLVPSAARIRRGGQTIDASELAKLSGYRAAVRYSETGGSKTVESVHVFGKG